MHELSLAAEVISIVEAELLPGAGIEKITLSVGMLSCVNPDSLVFCLDSLLVTKGYTKVVLSVNRIQALLLCLECGEQYNTEDVYKACPGCGSLKREILSGRDLTVDSIHLAGGV
jgi:hydrogenase nickel incorporation protein HypA/HybF